jgi:hypothetical protein
MEKTTINIFRGPTFKGAISFAGLIIFISGIVLLFLHLLTIPAIFFILTGLSLFLNMKGTFIDLENGVITSYMYLLFIKVGPSFELENYRILDVSTHKESIRMNSRGTGGDYYTKEFFVSMVSESKDKILLKSFLKKEDALRFKAEIEGILGNAK